MNRQYIKNTKIPDKPGIYIFRDKANRPLYIGRATFLNERIKSYFSNDLQNTRGRKIVEMVLKADHIDFVETKSVLEAILLEATEIRKYSPPYNTDLKDDKTGQYVIVTKEVFPRIIVMRQREFEKRKSQNKLGFHIYESIGPFGNGSNIKEILKILRKIFPYRDSKSIDKNHARFYESLGLSPALHDENYIREYMDNVDSMIKIMKGNISILQDDLNEKMNIFAREERFEEALKIKKIIFALSHINDLSLIKKDKRSLNIRIEAYDISHTSGQNAVGTMVVLTNGDFAKDEYKKFIIRNSKNDDTLNLSEIVFRRFNHKEWTYPDLIVVDGGISQLQAISKVLSSLRIDIPIVSVVKDMSHKAKDIIAHDKSVKKYANQYRDDIYKINAESHRFSISFHRKRRSKAFGV